MNCFLCGTQASKIFDQVKSFDIPLVYFQCVHCGLVFQNVEESIAANSDFYEETYRKLYQSSATPTGKDLWVQRARAKNLLNIFDSQKSKTPMRVLDIGASAGVLLKAFQSFFGCDVMGVEPGIAYRAHAEKEGIPMVASLEELMTKKPARFDVVVLSQVLEHLSNPLEILRTIRERLLDSQSMLLLEVPNFYAHDSYEVAHLACYTRHTLLETVRQAGYQPVFIKSHGAPRSSLLNLYLTLLARPQPEGKVLPSVRPERSVRTKRNLGKFYRRVVQKFFPHQAWLPLPDEKAD